MPSMFEGENAAQEFERRSLQPAQGAEQQRRAPLLVAEVKQQPQAQAPQSTSDAKETKSETIIEHKAVLVGPGSSGKTSVFNRYVYDEHGKTSQTEGCFFGLKEEKTKEGVKVNLSLWDTPGDRREDVTPYYCKNAKYLIYVLDEKQSIDEAAIVRYLSKTDKNASIHFVCNQKDALSGSREEVASLEKQTLEKMKSKFPGRIITCTFCSAKSGVGVKEVFQKVAESAVEQKKARLEQVDQELKSFKETIKSLIGDLSGTSCFNLFSERRNKKLEFLYNLQHKLNNRDEDESKNINSREDLAKYCRQELEKLDIEHRQLIIAGFFSHRVADLLKAIDPTIVSNIRREFSLKVGW